MYALKNVKRWRLPTLMIFVLLGAFVSSYNACTVGGVGHYDQFSSYGDGGENYPLTLAGWVSHTGGHKVVHSNAAAGFTSCPVMASPAANYLWGRPGVFCYEPSGANGGYLPTVPAPTVMERMRSFIMNGPQEIVGVPSIAHVGSLQKHPSISCGSPIDAPTHIVESSFVYAFARLYIPPDVAISEYQGFRFLSSMPDDGTILLVNGRLAGNTTIEDFRTFGKVEENYSLHLGQGNQQTNLVQGWNELVFILADNCKGPESGSVSGNGRIHFRGMDLPNQIPHVIQGRIQNFELLSNQGLIPNMVLINDKLETLDVPLDPNGGFTTSNVKPGHYTLALRVGDEVRAAMPIVLPPLQQGKWVHRFELTIMQ